MKKIYSFLLSLCAAFAVAGSAQAQSVTSVDELSNDAVYTIKSGRGYLVYNENKPDEGWCSENQNSTVTVTEDAPETYAQWVFYTATDGGRYLYNLANGKFLEKSGGKTAFVDTPTANNVTLIASTGGNAANYPVVVAFDNYQINMSKDQGTAIFTNWNDTGDEGNMAAIVKVADLDAAVKTAIEEKISGYAPVDPNRNLVEFANDKVYTFASSRGAWTYDATVSENTLVAASKATEAANGHFAVLTSDNGNHYVYVIGAGKFLSSEGNDTQLSDSPVILTLINNVDNSQEYPYIVSNNGQYMGISLSYTHGFYVGWNYLNDAGNQTLIKEVEGEVFDAAEALAKIQTYEAALEESQKVNLITVANDKAYTIESTRGFLAYDPAYVDKTTDAESGEETINYEGINGLVASTTTGVAADLADANKQFAILTSTSGAVYLYNIAAKKFVGVTEAYDPENEVGETTLTDAPSTNGFTLTENYKNSVAYPYILSVGERQLAISQSYTAKGGVISFWNDVTDPGNQFLIKEVGSFDATEALAAIAAYETATGISSATVTATATKGAYDLSGRKVSGKLSRGVYVIDGKKTLVK